MFPKGKELKCFFKTIYDFVNNKINGLLSKLCFQKVKNYFYYILKN